MVDWSKKRFDEISTRLGAFLKQAGFKDQDIFYVPVSGLTGENLVTLSTEPKLSSWYTGPTLLKAIGIIPWFLTFFVYVASSNADIAIQMDSDLQIVH